MSAFISYASHSSRHASQNFWRNSNAKIVAHLYDKRWGIETSYRVGHDFLARTTSKNYLIRLFYFQFSMILYNCWVIVNALLGIALHGEIPKKPIISAKLFGTVLYSIIKGDCG